MTNPITQIREEKELNRKQLAHKTGISYATLCYLEGGLCNSMQQKTLEVISEFSGKSSAEIAASYQQWKEGLKTQSKI